MVALTRPEYSGPGSFADGDMLHVCNYGEGGANAGGRGDGGMTLREYRATYSIWAIIGSPIIISADLRTVGERHPECLAMLQGSGALLALSQDPLGAPGILALQVTNATHESNDGATTTNIVQQIWTKPLLGDGRAVVYFNRAEHPLNMSLPWPKMAMEQGGRYVVTDVWGELPQATVQLPDGDPALGGQHTVLVQPHGVVVLRFDPLAAA